ncbi:hypothetical protein [Nostoc sp.]|uniref:hypothetical protein n=1 Tax=Nostoc sp. TaxID=1180 RepID=UPI002FFB45DE
MIVLLDTIALIELQQAYRHSAFIQLTSVEVLDVVISEFQHPNYTDFIKIINKFGFQTIQTESTWFNAARKYRDGTLSVQDALNLHYAKTFERILVTDEKPLQTLTV